MSRGYIKVSVGPGLNLRPSISFVDRTRIEADGINHELCMKFVKSGYASK